MKDGLSARICFLSNHTEKTVEQRGDQAGYGHGAVDGYGLPLPHVLPNAPQQNQHGVSLPTSESTR